MEPRAERATTRTSWRGTLSRRGFTLIELTLIVGVLAIMSVMVVPRVRSIQEGSAFRHFRIDARRIAQEARALAVSRGELVSVAFDESRSSLNAIVETSDEQPTVLSSVDLAPGVEAVEFVQEEAQSTPSEWRIRFYPDGRSDGGGVLFQSGEASFHLAVLENGTIRFDEGDLPDLSAEQWSAGEYEQRQ